ncbi:MAG: hypothetical protein C4334_13170 [Pyrinomonas sp.]
MLMRVHLDEALRLETHGKIELHPRLAALYDRDGATDKRVRAIPRRTPGPLESRKAALSRQGSR